MYHVPGASCQDLVQCQAPCAPGKTLTVPLRQSSSLDCGSARFVQLEAAETHHEAKPTAIPLMSLHIIIHRTNKLQDAGRR